MSTRHNLKLARMGNLINHAIRLRSASQPEKLESYAKILQEISKSIGADKNSCVDNQLPADQSVENPEMVENESDLTEIAEEDDSDSVMDTRKKAEEERRLLVLERIQKTFGKAKIFKFLDSNASSRSECATSETRRAAVIKLRQLETKEKQIQREKQELTFWLQTHASRPTTRTATVQSVLSQRRSRIDQLPRKSSIEYPRIYKTHETSSKPGRNEVCERIKTQGRAKNSGRDEVGELIQNLF